jgi:homospermidine synthase
MAEAVLALRRVRRRRGATEWSAWSDTAGPRRMVEQFVVASWEEHERQHARLTERDRARIQAVRALAEPGTEARVVNWAQVTPGPAPSSR